MRTHTRETQASLTPAEALQILREGNARFQANLKANRNLLQQVNETREGQWPFAIVLSCIDSRTSAELIFDQGLGDVFSVRIAGNFVNDDILGSMEFACRLAGSKLVVVLGHTHCGAIKGACDDVEMGHLTGLLEHLKPAVAVTARQCPGPHASSNGEFVQAVARNNVSLTMDDIRQRSAILRDMLDHGEIGLVGGMYDIETGAVEFYDPAR